MKAVIQRVREARVEINGTVFSKIDKGIFTLLGIEKGDDQDRLKKMIHKICTLRIFEDSAGKMNLSLLDLRVDHLIVSQFTLAADCSSGRRPSFTNAERPELARSLYEMGIDVSRELGVRTVGGVFQTDMQIVLTNDGPATFFLELR